MGRLMQPLGSDLGTKPDRKSGASPAARLRFLIAFSMGGLESACTRFWRQRSFEPMFRDFVVVLYGSVRATVPLLEVAREAASQLPSPLYRLLADYYGSHAREENGHDEWLLQDLERLGISRQEVLARTPSSAIAGLVGAQYYWVRHSDPVALLGYLAVLEGFPPQRATLDGIVARTNLSKAALRTFYKHAALDPEHCASLNELLDSLGLTVEQESLIGLSALHTLRYLTEVVEDVLECNSEDRARTKHERSEQA